MPHVGRLDPGGSQRPFRFRERDPRALGTGRTPRSGSDCQGRRGHHASSPNLAQISGPENVAIGSSGGSGKLDYERDPAPQAPGRLRRDCQRPAAPLGRRLYHLCRCCSILTGRPKRPSPPGPPHLCGRRSIQGREILRLHGPHRNAGGQAGGTPLQDRLHQAGHAVRGGPAGGKILRSAGGGTPCRRSDRLLQGLHPGLSGGSDRVQRRAAGPCRGRRRHHCPRQGLRGCRWGGIPGGRIHLRDRQRLCGEGLRGLGGERRQRASQPQSQSQRPMPADSGAGPAGGKEGRR
mmetsp:Transcript_7795/g.22896  ORF Transcript_7795/g.22896 Transcript_7795/m.22896 type:complete len:292 (+) Transcript_7795:182-1057(+)